MTYELKTEDLFQLLIVKAGTVSDVLETQFTAEHANDLNCQLTMAAEIEPILRDMLEINAELKQQLGNQLAE